MIAYIDSAQAMIACSVRRGFTSAEMGALVSKVARALQSKAKIKRLWRTAVPQRGSKSVVASRNGTFANG